MFLGLNRLWAKSHSEPESSPVDNDSQGGYFPTDDDDAIPIEAIIASLSAESADQGVRRKQVERAIRRHWSLLQRLAGEYARLNGQPEDSVNALPTDAVLSAVISGAAAPSSMQIATPVASTVAKIERNTFAEPPPARSRLVRPPRRPMPSPSAA